MDQSEAQSKGQKIRDSLELDSSQLARIFVLTSVRIVVIVGIVGVLAPFFTQSFVSLGLFEETPKQVPIVLLGVIAGLLLPLTRKIFTIAVSERI